MRKQRTGMHAATYDPVVQFFTSPLPPVSGCQHLDALTPRQHRQHLKTTFGCKY